MQLISDATREILARVHISKLQHLGNGNMYLTAYTCDMFNTLNFTAKKRQLAGTTQFDVKIYLKYTIRDILKKMNEFSLTTTMYPQST